MCLLCVSMMGVSAWAATETLSIDFESAVANYTSWDISNFAMSATGIEAHSGSAFGTTNGKTTGHAQTKEKVASPQSFTCYFSKTSNNTTASTWYLEVSTDGSNWTEVATQSATSMSKGEWIEFSQDLSSYSNVYVRLRYNGTTAVRAVDDVVLTYSTDNVNPTCEAPTFSVAEGAYTTAQSVTLSTTTDGATIYYTTNGDEPTTSSSVYSSAISVSTTTTIKAIAVKDGMDNSSVASATYTIVTFNHAGTQADPYTVADAHTAIDANINKTGVYATGIVSKIVTAYDSGFDNITFNFVTTSGDTEFLQAYRCGGDDVADVQVGDIVVVSGDLTKYGSTYEFGQGCTLVSLTHPVTPTITISSTDVNVPFAGANETITVTYNHVDKGVADVDFYESDGTTAATYDWITASLDANGNVEYLVEENTGAARTAYFKVYGLDDEANYVYSDLVTITQAKFELVSTFDLSTAKYTSASANEVVWNSTVATMVAAKAGASTNTNNYLGGSTRDVSGTPTLNTSTRFYTNSTITITPITGVTIGTITFEATTTGYATALANSSWTNATASASEKTVTVTPTNGAQTVSATIGGTTGHTEVTISYLGTPSVAPTYTRNVIDGNYGTLCLPYAATIEGATLYSIADKDASSITVTEAGTTAAAGVPYIFKATDAQLVATFTGTTYTAAGTANGLHGTYSDIDFADVTGYTDGDYYVVLPNKVQAASSKSGVDSNRAYIVLDEITTISGVKGIRLGFNEATAITELTEKTEATEGVIYNLQGQQLAAPQRGINIIGGKNVLVK